MGITEMQDTKAMTILCPYYMNMFWWPGMAKQMRQTIRVCTCNAFSMKVASPRPLYAPLWLGSPWSLLHVDFTSIETMMEPNKSPTVAKVLVFQDHFMKHVLAYVTPDQTVKTMSPNFYMEDTSLSLVTLARLLSDRGANFTSSVI